MKLIKSLFKLCVISAVLSIISLAFGYTYLVNYSWSKISSKDEMEFNAQTISSSSALPNKFYEVYDILKPGKRKHTMLGEFVWLFYFPGRGPNCRCDDIGYLAWSNDNLNLKFNQKNLMSKRGYWKFGFGLESKASSEKCFDYWINHSTYYNRRYFSSLDELAILKINKSIADLNTKEIILLIAWKDMIEKGSSDEDIVQRRFDTLDRLYHVKISEGGNATKYRRL